MRLSKNLLQLCSDNLGSPVELQFDYFKQETMLDISITDSNNNLLDKIAKSSLRYYYATFDNDDFIEKIENLNNGYKLNLMNIFHVDMHGRVLFICLY